LFAKYIGIGTYRNENINIYDKMKKQKWMRKGITKGWDGRVYEGTQGGSEWAEEYNEVQ